MTTSKTKTEKLIIAPVTVEVVTDEDRRIDALAERERDFMDWVADVEEDKVWQKINGA